MSYTEGSCKPQRQRKVVKTMLSALAGSFGLGFGNLFDFLRTTGLLGAIITVIVLCVKFKIVYLLVVEQGTEGILFRLGKAQYHRFGKKKGRLRRPQPGGHPFIRAFNDIVVVSKREIPLKLEKTPVTYKKRTFLLDGTISYKVIAPNTRKGDKLMLRSVLSVRDPNRDNEVSRALDIKVLGIVGSGLQQLVDMAEPNKNEFPILRFEDLEPLVRDKLKRLHGVRLVGFEQAPMGWLPVDGIHEVARKLDPDGSNVIPLPLPESAIETA